MKKTVKELAEIIDGTITGNPNLEIDSINEIKRATKGSIIFIVNQKMLKEGESSNADCLIIPSAIEKCNKTAIKVENPKLAFQNFYSYFYPRQCRMKKFINPL